MKKIVITGIAGFIGSNLADRLLQEGGYEVVGIDNLSAGVETQVPSHARFHALDIRSKEIYPLFVGADAVFHLAAKNCIADCQNDPMETASVNVLGSLNVFEAAKRGGVRKVIYAESSSLYEKTTLFPTPETEVCPKSFYAASKASAMHFAKSYEAFTNMAFTALRYFCVYGPRQDYRRTIPPLMSAFIIQLLRNQRPIIYGSGKKKRDFVYIDDVNDFHLKALHDSSTDGKVFNIGSGSYHSVREIFQIISKLLSSDLKPIYASDLPGEADVTLACIKEAEKTGWQPKTSLEEGLTKSIQFIKENVL